MQVAGEGKSDGRGRVKWMQVRGWEGGRAWEGQLTLKTFARATWKPTAAKVP